MIERFRYCLTVTVCAILLSGCGRQQAEQPVLRVWHFWSAPHHKAVLDSLVHEFERMHNCRVELTPLSWNEGKTKLMAAFSSGTAPDVLELGSDWIAQFSSSGVLAELKTEDVEPSRWLPWALPPCRWEGKYYAVPWVVDSRVLFVNVNLLDRAGASIPTTLDQLLRVCQIIHEKTDVAAFGATGADEHRLYKKILPLMWTFGGDILDSAGRCVLASDANIRALELYAALSRTGIIDTQKQLDAAFVRGELAVWNSGSWLIEKIQSENPLLRYRTIIMPGTSPSVPGISFAGGEYWAIARSSANKDYALAFIKYVTSKPQSLRFCRSVSEAGFPARQDAYGDSSLVSHPSKRSFAEQLKYARMTPVHPKWLDIERIFEAAVVDVLYGRNDARTALVNAHAAITQLLRRTTANATR